MTQELTAWRGETVYVDADIRSNPLPEQVALRRYRIRMVETEVASWQGARVGAYGDALVPLDLPSGAASVTAIEVGRKAPAGTYSFVSEAGPSLALRVLDAELPAQRLFPFYAEVNSNDCLLAYRHFQPEAPRAAAAEMIDLQVRVTQHALALARQFGIEPVKQSVDWFADPTTSPVQVRDRMDAFGYRQLVFQGAIAPPIIFCGSWDWDGGWRAMHPEIPYHPNAVFLEEVNREVGDRGLSGVMAWCADEPGTTGMPVEAAIARVRYVMDHAPRLIPMITTGRHSLEKLQGLAPDLPIRYCIVQNEDAALTLAGAKGSYFSCMAQGCGGSKHSRPQRTRFPVAVMEGDPVDDFQGAIHMARSMNALFALYYKINKRLVTTYADGRIVTCWDKGGLFDDQDGGNGDGTAMYVDESSGLVIPSVRMMHWHIAQQQVEKEMILAGES